MKKRYDRTDEYYIYIFDRMLVIAPAIGITAAIVFTAARLSGLFEYVNPRPLICFDAVCLSYFAIANFMRRYGILRQEAVDGKALFVIGIFLDLMIILQWNLISYIFPSKSFWGYAPMFVMISAFLFQTKVVLINIAGISASIAVSWIIMGDKLLPAASDQFGENLVLRIVALIISFSVIYTLTNYAEKFTLLVKENFRSMEEQNKELETMGRDIIDFTAEIIEERDSVSGSHVKRLKKYTRILAEQIAAEYPEYALTDEKIEEISLACVLHDVGKIAIPDSILLKPGKLSPEEFEIIKSHTELGAKIIDKLPESVGEEYKRCCREICLYHHEKYDGKGYPAGLRGEDIPIAAQIVSVVDCFDALTSERPYKKAYPGELAIRMILTGECGEFSDKMKNCLEKCRDAFLSN